MFYEHPRSPSHPRERSIGMQKEKREYSRGGRGVGSPGAICQAEVGGCAVSPSHRTRAREREAAAGATFPRIRNSIRELIGQEMDALARDFPDTDDMELKNAIERLAKEYGKLGEPWRPFAFRFN